MHLQKKTTKDQNTTRTTRIYEIATIPLPKQPDQENCVSVIEIKQNAGRRVPFEYSFNYKYMNEIFDYIAEFH